MAGDALHDRVVAAIGDQLLVEHELGRGGMAAVYQALDLRLQRRVAVKVLPPELSFNADVRERFLREAQTAARLSHPNIVPIYGVDERAGLVWFSMALVEGETLGQLMKRAPRRPMDEVRRVLHEVADALAYAHRHGVIHRDVKPDNVLVDRASGRPMVTDFGIARAAAADSRLTLTGVTVGTPTYMSPEQALGEREIDGRSDVYSLAVVGWQLLAGEPLYTASNAPALLMKHVSEPPRPIAGLRPDAPPELAGAIMRALAKKPEDRWKDAESFRDAVAGIGAPAAVATAWAMKAAAPGAPEAALSAADASRGAGPGARRSAGAPMPRLPGAAEPPEWLSPRLPGAPHPVPSPEGRVRSTGRKKEDFDAQPVERRVTVFRRKLAGNVVTIGTLGVVNALTSPDFWWFLIPSAFMTLDVLSKAGSLWADGVSVGQVFRRRHAPGPDAPATIAEPPTVEVLAARLVAPEVLAGAHGAVVRRVVADHRTVGEVLAGLGATERGMIPDVAPTARALSERAAGLASTLHRIDADVSGRSLPALDARLAALRAQPPTHERERQGTLLERQRLSLAELLDRRATLATQLESAALALENLKLDLLKLRSAGLAAGLDGSTSATQQARALSRDIGYAADAAEDVRKL